VAIQQQTTLVTVNSRNYAETQTGWNVDNQEADVTVPSGGTVLSASATFSYGQGVDYSFLTGSERTGTDSWSFYLKRHQGDNYYVNVHVVYDDGI
jgi:hypothetical protein